MMDALGDWVRSLIFLVLFAAFFELLLPGQAIKKFLRVIIGLFLLVAVLKPVTIFLSEDFRWRDVPVFKSAANDKRTLDLGSEKRSHLTQAVYQKEMERQLRALLEAMPEVNAVQAQVQLSTSAQAAEEKIVEVLLRVKLNATNQKDEIAVNLAKQQKKTALSSELSNKIVQRINALYQIPTDKISVYLWE